MSTTWLVEVQDESNAGTASDGLRPKTLRAVPVNGETGLCPTSIFATRNAITGEFADDWERNYLRHTMAATQNHH